MPRLIQPRSPEPDLGHFDLGLAIAGYGVPGIVIDDIGPIATSNGVCSAILADPNHVGAWSGIDSVGLRPAGNPVVPKTPHQRVMPAIAEEKVPTAVSEQLVAPKSPIHPVARGAAAYEVITTVTADDVPPAETADGVVLIGPLQDVHPVSANDYRRRGWRDHHRCQEDENSQAGKCARYKVHGVRPTVHMAGTSIDAGYPATG